MNKSVNLLLLFLMASSFSLSLASITFNCTRNVEINADPLQATGGTVMKGIPLPGSTLSFQRVGDDCNQQANKDACFNDDNIKAAKVTPIKSLVCSIIEKNYDLVFQVNMKYHCIDREQGIEIITTRSFKDPSSKDLCK